MSTLLRPPPTDPHLSRIESTLELRPLNDISPDLFTNLRPLWHPPGARGIYGGAVIAQCLAAAQKTVPTSFLIHSMHCYFVLAGNPDVPVIYAVEHVREGKSFATRTVQARQRGRAIFTTTLSFVREGSAGGTTLDHDTPLPAVPPPAPSEDEIKSRDGSKSAEDVADNSPEAFLRVARGPFESQMFTTVEGPDGAPHTVRTRNWMRAKGRISDAGGHQAHNTAIAYMSDSWFIGTISRAHKTWRTVPPRQAAADDEEHADFRERVRAQNGGKEVNSEGRPEIGMMVSLDHTIYFHRPKAFRADDWLYSESDNPWAGDGRGLVTQKIWTRDGVLVATCFQEGLARLKQPRGAEKSKL